MRLGIHDNQNSRLSQQIASSSIERSGSVSFPHQSTMAASSGDVDGFRRTGTGTLMVNSEPNFSTGRAVYAQSSSLHTGTMIRQGADSTVFTPPSFYSPYHTPSSWQIPTNRREVYRLSEYWITNEPRIGIAIDFYSTFPVSEFELTCKNRAVKRYFEKMCKKLNLADKLTDILREYYGKGDAFVMANLDCKHCQGTGYTEDGAVCEHQGATWAGLSILNPEEVEVTPWSHMMDDDPPMYITPNTELRNIVMTGKPEEVYARIPDETKAAVRKGQPIKLDPLCVHHFKHGAPAYQTYGVSLLRRLFPTLYYRDKLRQAQWLIAERHIVPVKIVRIGSEERPASSEDIQKVRDQLSEVANDPLMTIVTHHAFDYEWVGTCYDLETEVLTKQGFKSFSDVTPDDLIACYDPDAEAIEYHPYQEKHEYHYDSNRYGGLLNFTGDECDVCVTSNHMMWVKREEKWQKIRADAVKISDEFLVINEEDLVTTTVVDIKNVSYDDTVWCFTVPTGLFVTRRNGFIGIHGNSGKILQLTNEFDLIEGEMIDGLGLSKAILSGEGPTYANAQVGIEVLIRRLGVVRKKLAHWIEENLFKPIAEFNGFTDVDERGDDEALIYPKVKWAELRLRDDASKIQYMWEARKMGDVSARTFLEKMLDIDFDQEVDELRMEEMSAVLSNPQLDLGTPDSTLGGGYGAGGGALGGMGMPPPMPPAGGAGGEMGGMPPMEGGGMPPMGGGEMGSALPMGGGPTPTASILDHNYRVVTAMTNDGFALRTANVESKSPISRIYKDAGLMQIERASMNLDGTGYRGQLSNDPDMSVLWDGVGPTWGMPGYPADMAPRVQASNGVERFIFGAKEDERVQPNRYLNQLEATLLRGILQQRYPYQFWAQYLINGNPNYRVDFAFPQLKIAIEADGERWHGGMEDIERDRRRDAQLASQGWLVLRFREDEIEDQLQNVISVITHYVDKKAEALGNRVVA